MFLILKTHFGALKARIFGIVKLLKCQGNDLGLELFPCQMQAFSVLILNLREMDDMKLKILY